MGTKNCILEGEYKQIKRELFFLLKNGKIGTKKSMWNGKMGTKICLLYGENNKNKKLGNKLIFQFFLLAEKLVLKNGKFVLKN